MGPTLKRIKMVLAPRLERGTPSMSRKYSNQLSYASTARTGLVRNHLRVSRQQDLS